eukprot:COSAG05_NODE_14676_length_390_cov_1.051546_1_plen_51_part_01
MQVNNRHGIRLIFRQTGQLGIFDFQTLFINLVVASGMLSGALGRKFIATFT